MHSTRKFWRKSAKFDEGGAIPSGCSKSTHSFPTNPNLERLESMIKLIAFYLVTSVACVADDTDPNLGTEESAATAVKECPYSPGGSKSNCTPTVCETTPSLYCPIAPGGDNGWCGNPTCNVELFCWECPARH